VGDGWSLSSPSVGNNSWFYTEVYLMKFKIGYPFIHQF